MILSLTNINKIITVIYMMFIIIAHNILLVPKNPPHMGK